MPRAKKTPTVTSALNVRKCGSSVLALGLPAAAGALLARVAMRSRENLALACALIASTHDLLLFASGDAGGSPTSEFSRAATYLWAAHMSKRLADCGGRNLTACCAPRRRSERRNWRSMSSSCTPLPEVRYERGADRMWLTARLPERVDSQSSLTVRFTLAGSFQSGRV
jgi:hypothetical protein